MAGIFSLRNWVMKQLMKTDKSGIMRIPDKGKIDFGEMMLREELFLKGINPGMIKSEKQLDNILDTPVVSKSERVKPKKSGEVIEVDFGNFPEKKAGGGRTGLSYLLAEDTNERMSYAEGNGVYDEDVAKEKFGERVRLLMDEGYDFAEAVKEAMKEEGFASGGRVPFAMGRRAFLKLLGGIGAGIGALKTGALKMFGKEGATVAKELTQVPIKNIEGMPVWFKPLVNKVIKEGDDVTKKFATKEREIVHKKRLGDPKDEFADDITVTQDLETGNVRVEYHSSTNMGEAPIQLDYKAAEVIEPDLATGKGGGKIKEKFTAVESEPRVVNWDGDIEFDGENVVGKVDELLSDTTKLEAYATGKKPTIKKLLESEKKQKKVQNLMKDQGNQADYIETKYGPGPAPSDYEPYASGGLARMLGE